MRFVAVLTAVFGLLYFATSSNELLKQLVLTPEAQSSLMGEADCRADELIEEGLSLRECELMRLQLEIAYESSPNWFRSAQLFLHGLAVAAALSSVYLGLHATRPQLAQAKLLRHSLSFLLILDIATFLAALQTGPLLRTQYLWPIVLWFFVHLSLAVAVQGIVAALNEKAGRGALLQ